MVKLKHRVISSFLAMAFLIYSLVGFIGIQKAYAGTLTASIKNGKQVSVQKEGLGYKPGTALKGIPERNFLKATEKDVAWLNKVKISTISPNQLPALNSTKSFYAYNYSTGGYDTIHTELKRIGTHCYIYLQEGTPNVTELMLDNMVKEFEKIYQTTTNAFGSAPDVDMDKRINIILMDIQDGYSEGTYIAGFFDSMNQLPRFYHNSDLTGQSNEKEIFYMDVKEGLPTAGEQSEDDFYGTLAHEFQHMIQYSVYLNNFTSETMGEDVWLNESMSDLSQFINGYGHPMSHVAYFLGDDFNGGYEGGYGLIDWNHDYPLANYGAAYLFGLYMYEQYGPDFIKSLVQNPKAGIGSIDDTLTKLYIHSSFKELYEKCMLATAIDGTGEFGFANIDLTELRNMSYNNYNQDGSAIDPYMPDMRFYSLSDDGVYDGRPLPLQSFSGRYRVEPYFIIGSNEFNTVHVGFMNSIGNYYIVKATSSDNSPIETYTQFVAAPKTIEKLNAASLIGHKFDIGPNQAVSIVSISEDQPIHNYVSLTEKSSASSAIQPPVTTNLSGSAYYNVVKLTWNAPSDTYYAPGIKGYNIYRDGLKINNKLVTTTTYTDPSVAPNRSYTYAVETVGGNDTFSPTKSIAWIANTPSTPDIEAPASPTISYLSSGADSDGTYVRVSLAPSGSTDVDHYEVVQMYNGMIDDCYYSIPPIAIDRLYFGGVLYNTEYTYYAFAVDTAGNYSAASNKINVKVGQGLVSLPSNPSAPSGLQVSNVWADGATVSWNPSISANGILEYNIYRNNVFIAKWPGTENVLQYTDRALQPLTRYEYKIEAVDNSSLRLNSDYSQPVSFTTKSSEEGDNACISYHAESFLNIPDNGIAPFPSQIPGERIVRGLDINPDGVAIFIKSMSDNLIDYLDMNGRIIKANDTDKDITGTVLVSFNKGVGAEQTRTVDVTLKYNSAPEDNADISVCEAVYSPGDLVISADMQIPTNKLIDVGTLYNGVYVYIKSVGPSLRYYLSPDGKVIKKNDTKNDITDNVVLSFNKGIGDEKIKTITVTYSKDTTVINADNADIVSSFNEYTLSGIGIALESGYSGAGVSLFRAGQLGTDERGVNITIKSIGQMCL